MRRKHRLDDPPSILDGFHAKPNLFCLSPLDKTGSFKIHRADDLKGDRNHDFQAIDHFPLAILLRHHKAARYDDMPPHRFFIPARIRRDRFERHGIKPGPFRIER
ncbi:MAG: hypothetical protein JW395_2938 [Nitrospira sp.]|nr:hypothetical protein [Nitrospira sp.]